MAVNSDYTSNTFKNGSEIMQEDQKIEENTGELPVLIKIQRAKTLLNQYDIQKTGNNNFHKYKYLELSDITQPILDIFDQLALVHKFTFHPLDTNVACLIITDINTGSNTTYYFPCTPISDTGNKGMQQKGGIQTYARRYLWQQALDIAIPDTIDSRKNSIDKNRKSIIESQKQYSGNYKQSHEDYIQQGLKIRKDLEDRSIEPNSDNLTEELLKLHKNNQITTDCFNYLIKNVTPQKPKDW